MTTAEAVRVLESELLLRGSNGRAGQVLATVKAALAPKPRKGKTTKLHPAVKAADRPAFFAWPGIGTWSWNGASRASAVARKQRELYLATFDDPKAQAERIDGLPRSPQFDYDPPAKMKDDERRTLITALGV